jgi:hypothetical protein
LKLFVIAVSFIHGILHALTLPYETLLSAAEGTVLKPSIRHRLVVELTFMPMVVVTGSVQPPMEQEAGPVSPVRKTVIRAVDRAPLMGRVYAGCPDELP